MPRSGIGSFWSTVRSLASMSCVMSSSPWSGAGRDRAAHRRDAVVGAVTEEATDDLAHLVQRLGAVQDRLVLRDVVVGAAHLDEVERAELHRAEFLDLAVAREDPCAVRAQLAVLDDDAELDG